jgi:thioredoxin 1
MWRGSGEGSSEIIFCQCNVSHPVNWSVTNSRHTVLLRPTFILLKGSTQVDTLKGANKAYVLPPFISSIGIYSSHSGLENMIKKHATSTTTSFSGKGQTVGGEPVPPDVIGEVQNSLSRIWGHFSQLDPQFIVLALLLGLYYVFWFV